MTARPIRLAPDLDPADAVHVPRWLHEAQQAEFTATERLTKAPGWPHWSNEAELAAFERANPTDPNHARWLDG